MCVGLPSTCGTISQGSTSIDDDVDDEGYRVLVLGGPGVGKSAITQQFLTSEYMAAQNTSFGQFHFLCGTITICDTTEMQNNMNVYRVR